MIPPSVSYVEIQESSRRRKILGVFFAVCIFCATQWKHPIVIHVCRFAHHGQLSEWQAAQCCLRFLGGGF